MSDQLSTSNVAISEAQREVGDVAIRPPPAGAVIAEPLYVGGKP